jgi:hypothetical protein
MSAAVEGHFEQQKRGVNNGFGGRDDPPCQAPIWQPAEHADEPQGLRPEPEVHAQSQLP